MGRRPRCSREGLNRGAWSRREDKILSDYISAHGEGKWRELPVQAGLNRCGKSCRLRWLNYLRPDIKRGNITEDEENLIIKLHALLGNRWSLIAGRLPGRTDNEIKNYWNTNLSKKMMPARICIEKSCRGREASGKAADCTSHVVQVKPAEQQPAFLVKTKAVRCTKVYIPSPGPPDRDDELAAAALSSSSATQAVRRDTDHSAAPAAACCYLEDFNMEELVSGFQIADDAGGGFLQQLCADVDGVVTPVIGAYGDFAQGNSAAGGGGGDGDGSLLWFSDDGGCTESQIAAEVETLALLIDSEEEQLEKQPSN